MTILGYGLIIPLWTHIWQCLVFVSWDSVTALLADALLKNVVSD